MLWLCLILPYILPAQIPCGTPDMPSDKEAAQQELIQRLRLTQVATQRTPLTTTYLAIKPQIARTTAGTGGLSLTTLNDALAELNRSFKTANIEFYFCGTAPSYIDNDNLYNGTYTGADALGFQATYGATNAHNVYFCNSLGGVGGYSYGATQNKDYNRTYVLNGQANDDKTLIHEIGHYFNLAHTFNNATNATISERELVTRSNSEVLPRLSANCSTKGDYVCDTPADPRGNGDADVSSCIYSGTVRDANMDAFAPSVNNYMDYNFCDPYNFSTGQYTRIQNALLINNTPNSNPSLAYTLDCAETTQTAPSGLTLSLVNTSISLGNVLNWTDNSSVETGYIIERATSEGGSYDPIGGVAPNATTFTDLTVAKNTTYYYRIKPSNSKANYSGTVSIATPFYCGPSYSSPCTIGSTTASHIINRFKITTTGNTTLFDNNGSGFSANSFGDYYNTFSATVTKGATYNFQMNTFYGSNGYFPQHFGIFVDTNQDGDFDDAGEQVYRSTGTIMNGTTQITGSFVIPSTATTGTTRLRIRCRYNSEEVADACGSYGSGETEDYKLIITTPLPVELLDFRGQYTEGGNLLTWETAQELNNKGFQVERSPQPPKGAFMTWQSIGFVKAKGNAATYDFTDIAPPSGTGGTYYRLRQMDLDGKETFSKVIAIKQLDTDLSRYSREGGKIKVYPNPANDVLTIENVLGKDIDIVNTLGQVVLSQKRMLNATINIQPLQSGVYFVKTKGEVVRFIKQ